VVVPLQCRHCEDAPCVAVCPTGALHREDEEGPVLIDSELCVGCKMCVVVCPFGVITMSRDKAIIKCDLCIDRLEQGQEPACVAACPTGALRLEEAAEVAHDARQRLLESIREAAESTSSMQASGA